MASVRVKFDGDKTQLEQCYRDLAAQHAKLENQVARLGAASAKASQDAVKGQMSANDMVAAGLSGVVSLAAGWLSVDTALGSYKKELEEGRKLQADACNE